MRKIHIMSMKYQGRIIEIIFPIFSSISIFCEMARKTLKFQVNPPATNIKLPWYFKVGKLNELHVHLNNMLWKYNFYITLIFKGYNFFSVTIIQMLVPTLRYILCIEYSFVCKHHQKTPFQIALSVFDKVYVNHPI